LKTKNEHENVPEDSLIPGWFGFPATSFQLEDSKGISSVQPEALGLF
jgi:hypothetical protein